MSEKELILALRQILYGAPMSLSRARKIAKDALSKVTEESTEYAGLSMWIEKEDKEG